MHVCMLQLWLMTKVKYPAVVTQGCCLLVWVWPEPELRRDSKSVLSGISFYIWKAFRQLCFDFWRWVWRDEENCIKIIKAMQRGRLQVGIKNGPKDPWEDSREMVEGNGLPGCCLVACSTTEVSIPTSLHPQGNWQPAREQGHCHLPWLRIFWLDLHPLLLEACGLFLKLMGSMGLMYH